MRSIDSQLYKYLIDHLTVITDEWLAAREKKSGSVYSADADQSIEQLLRKQNRLTNLTVASSLLEEQDTFEKQKKQWALEVAESRVASNTPIHEVQDALRAAREAYWHFVEKFVKLNKSKVTHEDILKWGVVIHKAFDELNIKFSEMYFDIMMSRLSAQQSLIEELGSPVIPITSSKGILPLVGDIDTMRAKSILEQIPKKCVEAGISHLFIDLSGVSIIDTMVAQQIFQIIQVLNLLGIKSTMTGIRPEIAQTAVQLGIDFSEIESFSSLQQILGKYSPEEFAE
ncbi:STAS domain-containing protein [Pseudobacillus badius]|uniref:STAS domain-containing protein n=1 Tax=Bacillus badius TaxID=1455 RepID=UPI0007B09A88|nr:STAS domain-containing protein [Bacillus badius]KZO01027.1 sulfate transporter [Bacillus badius]OCS89062.1 sulfate transporter [Bacillus badius]OVE48225.1 sulfate transporter [Bacillus badius]TDW00535.1 rsbT co-antagonist protein RsbR [Bacillus badius]UAT31166.1 STAS domain-containing protein [Bacillus badius]